MTSAELKAQGRLMKMATYASLAVAVFLIVLKFFAYFYTGSLSILSSLLDSLLDSGASLLNMIAVYHSLEPADREHRFGHGKAEALSGLGQALFIALSSVLLLVQALRTLLSPEPVTQTGVGIVVMIISIIATIALVFFQKKVIAKTHSTAISADSLHYTGDVLLNAGVICSLVVAGIFHITIVDPLFALGVSGFLLFSTGTIMFRSIAELMDREIPDEQRDTILKCIQEDTQILGVHDFRTRKSGRIIFIEAHIELPPLMPLLQTHEIVEEIEERIIKKFPTAHVLIHQDPAGHEEARLGLD